MINTVKGPPGYRCRRTLLLFIIINIIHPFAAGFCFLIIFVINFFSCYSLTRHKRVVKNCYQDPRVCVHMRVSIGAGTGLKASELWVRVLCVSASINRRRVVLPTYTHTYVYVYVYLPHAGFCARFFFPLRCRHLLFSCVTRHRRLIRKRQVSH